MNLRPIELPSDIPPRRDARTPRPSMAVRVIGPSIAYVPLTHDRYALIDSCDADALDAFTWRTWKNPAATTYYATATNKNIAMHRLIMGLKKGDPFADHRNHNGLDNRRCNLRVATPNQNTHNRILPMKAKSGLAGAWFVRGRWISGIRANGKQIGLGTFNTKEEAHEAYKAALTQYHGEYARTLEAS